MSIKTALQGGATDIQKTLQAFSSLLTFVTTHHRSTAPSHNSPPCACTAESATSTPAAAMLSNCRKNSFNAQAPSAGSAPTTRQVASSRRAVKLASRITATHSCTLRTSTSCAPHAAAPGDRKLNLRLNPVCITADEKLA